MKRNIILSIIGVLLVGAFLWVWGHSTLNISLDNADGTTDISYTIVDKSGNLKSFVSTSSSVSKIIGRGEYQIFIEQGETTYMTVVNTAGFLRKTEVYGTLKNESARSFVGANPAYCTQLVNNQLISSDCYGPAHTIKHHRPATPSVPQYVVNLPGNNLLGSLEGMAYTKLGTIALTSIPIDYAEEGLYGHYVSVIADNLVPGRQIKLEGLDPSKLYAMEAYKDGFIAYDLEIQEIFYISSLSQAPVKINIGKPQDTGLTAENLAVNNDVITIVYSPKENEDNFHGAEENFESSAEHNHEDEVADIEVAVIDGSTTRHFDLHGSFASVTFCGENKLCTINSSAFEVYDISSSTEAEPLYKIHDVNNLKPTPRGMLLITKRGMVLFNPETREGFVEYDFGEYSYCGVTLTTDGYLLCVGHEKMGKAVLHVSQSTLVNNRLDKLVLGLYDVKEIKAVSVYGNLIHVVPDYGNPVYNSLLGRNTINPQIKTAADEAIATAVKKLGLDEEPYKVINTGIYR